MEGKGWWEQGLPAKIAVALRYEPEEEHAPRVVVSGRGHLAQRIIELAREEGVYVHEDPVLAAALAELRIGELIPPELYQAVAEVLAFVYRINGKLKLEGGGDDKSEGARQD